MEPRSLLRQQLAAPTPEGLRQRSRRVVGLLAVIVVLSIADLILTLSHLHSFGMVEANPVARFVIHSTQSPWILILFKCGTVGVCAALLFRVRTHRSAEYAAWMGAFILLLLCAMWMRYNEQMTCPDHLHLVKASVPADEWVVFD